MSSMTPGLAGHRGLRGDILIELKKTQPVTAKELAVAFDVSANAVRRHLKELEAAGLVKYDIEHKGTGAPAHAFSLTEGGEALFPTQYGEMLNDVLGLVAKGGGRKVVKEIFLERFREHAERIRSEMPNATLEEKVKAVAGLLSDQGFMSAWENTHGAFTLAQHNCAVRAVAESFPEICAAEAEFLQEVLQTEVTRDSHIPEGCNSCQYSISHDSKSLSVGSRTTISEGGVGDE